MREIVTCSTPYCANSILLREPADSYVFCPKCKALHSMKILKIQVDHEKGIKDIILDARIFKSANGMADYVGVTFVTMYNWIRKYFNMSFQEFRRNYICKSDSCYLLNISRSSYSRNDYILKKIRSRSNYCACINSLEPNHVMTNCPPEMVAGILRGYPVIKRISDGLFSLAPRSVHYKKVKPINYKIVKSVHRSRRIIPVHLEFRPKSIHILSKLRDPLLQQIKNI